MPQQLSYTSGLDTIEDMRNALSSAFTGMQFGGYNINVNPLRGFGKFGWHQRTDMFDVEISHPNLKDDAWRGVVKGGPNKTLLIQSGSGWQLIRGDLPAVGETGLMWSGDREQGANPYYTGIQSFARRVVTALGDVAAEKSYQGQTTRTTANEAFYEGLQYSGIAGRTGMTDINGNPISGNLPRNAGFINSIDSPGQTRFMANLYNVPIIGDIAKSIEALQKDVKTYGSKYGSPWSRLFGGGVWRPKELGGALFVPPAAAGTEYAGPGGQQMVSMLSEKFLKRAYESERRQIATPSIVTRERITPLPPELLSTSSVTLRPDMAPYEGIRTSALTSINPLPWQSGQMQVRLPEQIRQYVRGQGGMLEASYPGHRQMELGNITSPADLLEANLQLDRSLIGKRLETGQPYTIGTLGTRMVGEKRVPGELSFQTTQQLQSVTGYDIHYPREWTATPEMMEEVAPVFRQLQERGVENFVPGTGLYLDVGLSSSTIAGFKGGGAKGQYNLPVMGNAPLQIAGAPVDYNILQEAKNVDAVMLSALQALPTQGKNSIYNLMGTLYRGYRGQFRAMERSGEQHTLADFATTTGFKSPELLLSDITSRSLGYQMNETGEWQAQPYENINQRLNQFLLGRFGIGRVKGSFLVEQYTPSTRRDLRSQVLTSLQGQGYSPEESMQQWRGMNKDIRIDRSGKTPIYSMYTAPETEFIRTPKLQTLVPEYGGVGSDQGNIERALEAQGYGELLGWFKQNKGSLFQNTPAREAIEDILSAQFSTQMTTAARGRGAVTIGGPGGLDPSEINRRWLANTQEAGGNLTDIQDWEAFGKALQSVEEEAGILKPLTEGEIRQGKKQVNLPFFFSTSKVGVPSTQSVLDIESQMYALQPKPWEAGATEWELQHASQAKATTRMLGVVSGLLQAEEAGVPDINARGKAITFYEQYAFSDRLRKQQGGIFTRFGGSGLIPAGQELWTSRALRRNYAIQGGNLQGGGEYRQYLRAMQGAPVISARPPWPNVGTEEMPGSYTVGRIMTPASILGRTIMTEAKKAGIEPPEIIKPQSYIANLGDLDYDPTMEMPAVFRTKKGTWQRFDPEKETYEDFTKRIVKMGTPEAQQATFEGIFGALANKYNPFSQNIAEYINSTLGRQGMGMLEKRLVTEAVNVQEQVNLYNEEKGIRMGSTYNTYLRRFGAEAAALGVPDKIATQMADSLAKYYQFAVDMEAKGTLFETLVGTGGFFLQEDVKKPGFGQLQYGARIGGNFKSIGRVWNPTKTDASKLIQSVGLLTALQSGSMEGSDQISASGLAALFTQADKNPETMAGRLKYATNVLQEVMGPLEKAPMEQKITPFSSAINRLVGEGVFGIQSVGGMSMLSRTVEYGLTHPEKLPGMIAGSQSPEGKGMLKIAGQEMTWAGLEKLTSPGRTLYQFALAKQSPSDLYMNPINVAQTLLYAQEQGTAGGAQIQQLWKTVGRAMGLPNPATSKLSMTNPLTGQLEMLETPEQISALGEAFGQVSQMLNVQNPAVTANIFSAPNRTTLHMSELAQLSAEAEGRGTGYGGDIRMGMLSRVLAGNYRIPDIEKDIFRQTPYIRQGVALEQRIAPTLGAHTGAAGRGKGLIIKAGDQYVEMNPDVMKTWRTEEGKAMIEFGDVKRSKPRNDLAYRRQVGGYAAGFQYAMEQGAYKETAPGEYAPTTVEAWMKETAEPRGLDVGTAMEALGPTGGVEAALYYGNRAMRSPVNISAALPGGVPGMVEQAVNYFGQNLGTTMEALGKEAASGTKMVPAAAEAIRQNWGRIKGFASTPYASVEEARGAVQAPRTAAQDMLASGMLMPATGGGGGNIIPPTNVAVAGAVEEPGGNNWMRQMYNLLGQALGQGGGVTEELPAAEHIDRLFKTEFGRFEDYLQKMGGGSKFIGGGGKNILSQEAATAFVSKAATFIPSFGKEVGGQLAEPGYLTGVAGNIQNIMAEYFQDEGTAKQVREAATPYEAQGIAMKAAGGGGIGFLQYLKGHPVLKPALGLYRDIQQVSKIAVQNLGSVDADLITRLSAQAGMNIEPMLSAMAGVEGGVDAPAYQQIRQMGGLFDVLGKETRGIPAPKKAERPLTPVEQRVMQDWGDNLITSTDEIRKQTEALRKYKGGMLELSDVIKGASGETDNASKRIMKLSRTMGEVTGERVMAQQALGRAVGEDYGAEKLTPTELRTALSRQLIQGNVSEFNRYYKAAIKEEETPRDIFATFKGVDEETLREKNYGQFARRALGGFGLMYMRSIAGIMAQPLMMGYQEGEAQQQAITQTMGGLYGGIAPNRTQEIAYQNAMAMYGGQGFAQMRGAYANLLRREPGVATLGGAAVSGVGVAGALATLGMWTGTPALGSAAVLGPVGIGAGILALGAQGYAANLDVEGSSVRMAQMLTNRDISWRGNQQYTGGNFFQQLGTAFAAPNLGYSLAQLPGVSQEAKDRADRQREESQFLAEIYSHMQGGGDFKEFLSSRGQSGKEAYWQQQYASLLPGVEQYANVPIQGLAQAQMLSTMLGTNLQQYAPGFEQLGYALAQGVPVYETARQLAAQPGTTLAEQREQAGQLISGWYGPGGQGLSTTMAEEYALGGARLSQLGRAGERIQPRITTLAPIYAKQIPGITGTLGPYALPGQPGTTGIHTGGEILGFEARPEWQPGDRAKQKEVLATRLEPMQEYEWTAYQRRMGLREARGRLGLSWEAVAPEEYVGLSEQQLELRARQDMAEAQRIDAMGTIQTGLQRFGVTLPQMQPYNQMTLMQMSQVQTQQQQGFNIGQTMLMGGASPGFANAFGLTMGNLNPQQFNQYNQMMNLNPQAWAGYALQNPQAWSQISAGGLTGVGGAPINPMSLVAVDIKMVDGKPIQTGMAWGTSSLAMPGISSNAMAGQLFAQSGLPMGGGSFVNALISGGTMGGQLWQLGRQAQYQQAQAGQQLAQIALQEKYQPQFWAIEDQTKAVTRGQSLWQLDFQQRQMQQQSQFFYQNIGIQQQQAQMQRGWAREDWGFQDQTRAMQWGWRQEDFAEQRRFMTGRDRRLSERQMGRETIMHDLEGEQIDKQRKRQQEMWAVEDERILLQIQQHEAQLAMQEESLNKTREYYEQTWALQDQQTELNRAYWRESIELQKQAAGISASYAKEMQNVALAMELIQQKAQTMAGERSLMNPDTMTQLGEQLAVVDPLFSSMFVESLGQLGSHLENMAENYTLFRMNTGNLSTILDQLSPAYEQFVEMIRQTASIITGEEVTVGTGTGGGGGGDSKEMMQHGGIALAGRDYIINEDLGGESFSPFTSGMVVPSHRTNPWMNETRIWGSSSEKQQVTIIVKIGDEEIKRKVIDFVSQEVD